MCSEHVLMVVWNLFFEQKSFGIYMKMLNVVKHCYTVVFKICNYGTAL
jgi:hypothetical protein